MRHIKPFTETKAFTDESYQKFLDLVESHFIEIKDTFDITSTFYSSTFTFEFNDEREPQAYSLHGDAGFAVGGVGFDDKVKIDIAIKQFTEFTELLTAIKKVARKLEAIGLESTIDIISRHSSPPSGIKLHLKRT